MAASLDHPNFRIIDDFLDEETWTALWSDFQFMELHPVTRTLGAWKLDDGVPLGGQELVVGRGAAPASGDVSVGNRGATKQTPLALVIAAILADPEHYQGLVADEWDRISARPYVYPQGTGLSWHVDDHELYAGAFIYYAHPHWNAHWGGELLVAESDPETEAQEGALPIMGHRFETESYSERLLDMGCGNFIMPKPNRMIVLGRAPHMIARINPAAGANVRASVTGFFLKKNAEQVDEANV